MIGRAENLLLVFALIANKAAAQSGEGSLEPDGPQHHPLIRGEPVQRSVLLEATGELVKKADPAPAPASPIHAEPLGDTKTCNMDYMEGPANGLACAAATHTPITDSAVCLEAAQVTGTQVMPRATFLIAHPDFSKHPRGCFKMPCTEGNATECYFFNDDDDESFRSHADTVTGTPICTRDKYTNGTKDGSACYSIYNLIASEKECNDAAECLGYPSADTFRIDEDEGNTKRYDLFPQGCFIMKKDQHVYFNAYTSSMAKPTNPVGTPICKVTGVTG